VGAFESGDAHNSELWADTDVVAATYRRGSSTASVTVRLTGADAFDAYKAALASDPRLTVDVKTTRAYYTDQSAALAKLIRVLGITIAAIMAIGAVFGALNTMYAAVATRSREIATLRAIGFRAVPVIVSVLLETMLLALLGGLLGAALTWLVFNHYTVSTLGSNFHPGGVRLPGVGRGAVDRPEVGARDRPDRRPVSGVARGAPAGHRGVAGVVGRGLKTRAASGGRVNHRVDDTVVLEEHREAVVIPARDRRLADRPWRSCGAPNFVSTECMVMPRPGRAMSDARTDTWSPSAMVSARAAPLSKPSSAP
jgi:hypothetical protein